MFGILNINKAAGVSSRQIVTAVTQALKSASQNSEGDSSDHAKKASRRTKIKAGHAGTLDPLADGVLLVCLGKATRLIPYVQDQIKEYDGEFELGVSSPSDDTETERTVLPNPVIPAENQIEETLQRFIGTIQQVPPAYSAIHIDGKRAYKLARKGVEFDIKPKTVTIESITVLSFEYPFLRLKIRCGSGTYIRSLGRDLAEALGTAAVMTSLTRTAIGTFSIEDALASPHISLESIKENLVSPLRAVAHLPQRPVDQDEVERMKNGRFIDWVPEDFPQIISDEQIELVAVDANKDLVAILKPSHGHLKPAINFIN